MASCDSVMFRIKKKKGLEGSSLLGIVKKDMTSIYQGYDKQKSSFRLFSSLRILETSPHITWLAPAK